jgi:hypothetical protein
MRKLNIADAPEIFHKNFLKICRAIAICKLKQSNEQRTTNLKEISEEMSGESKIKISCKISSIQ